MAGAHENDGSTPDDLPDLPEEWGVIVIPDDLSELSDEVEVIRAELRQSDRSDRWHRLFDRPGLRQLRQVGIALLRAPVLIISMAVLVTVASLFASAWPGPPRQPVVQRPNDDHLYTLPALELAGDDGRMVPLRAKLPAVILVTDGCDCDGLITATAEAAQDRPQIAIIVIAAALSGAASTKPTATQPAVTQSGAAQSAATRPAGQPSANQPSANQPSANGTGQPGAGGPSGGATPATQSTPRTTVGDQSVQVLRDLAGSSVREQLKLGRPDGTAAALLVDSKGRIVHEIARTASVDDIQPYLAQI
jgi:hypothetical protein